MPLASDLYPLVLFVHLKIEGPALDRVLWMSSMSLWSPWNYIWVWMCFVFVLGGCTAFIIVSDGFVTHKKLRSVWPFKSVKDSSPFNFLGFKMIFLWGLESQPPGLADPKKWHLVLQNIVSAYLYPLVIYTHLSLTLHNSSARPVPMCHLYLLLITGISLFSSFNLLLPWTFSTLLSFSSGEWWYFRDRGRKKPRHRRPVMAVFCSYLLLSLIPLKDKQLRENMHV